MTKPRSKKSRKQAMSLSDEQQRIIDTRHQDPFAVLGRHINGTQAVITAFLPNIQHVEIVETGTPLVRKANTDLFTGTCDASDLPQHYQLHWLDGDGNHHTNYDPYCFMPQLADLDLHLFAEGRHWQCWRWLGAHPHTVDGIDGVLFALWAPSAERISVVGDFNGWDGRRHPMRLRGGNGIWELFIPALGEHELYKFELRTGTGNILLKSDPYAQRFEFAAGTANRVCGPSRHDWQDSDWLSRRQNADWLHAPLSIYEVHAGSWRRHENGDFLNYRELAHELVKHVKPLGFTHIELMPLSEHPFYGSWGYQTTGYYAPTCRYGEADDLRYLVDYCHQNDIGIIIDWVPAHFPKDAHGLARFDGSALYEHADPRLGEHREWDTLIFNYGRHEVRNFLIANAIYWLEEFHIDGLRVDAVASMLYLDYARDDGDWLPNKYGGRENLEAIEFMRQLNTATHELFPGTMIMAEESTDWPMVSRPAYLGGLGYSLKWNMGWMHDVLDYMKLDPIYRQYHHNKLTFGMMYAYNENFILPFSHDEVVHGKSSMRYKMSGDEWQQFANLRLLYTFHFTHPGKQLLFMGCEFGQGPEWDHEKQLDWHVLDYPLHSGLMRLVSDLNHFNRNHSALYHFDFEPQGFEWIDCNDSGQSVLSFLRMCENETLVVVLNFTPVPRNGYRIGVPEAGTYEELLNSDSEFYGGSNVGNGGGLHTEDLAWMDKPYSLTLNLPPLGGVILKKMP